jgi:hypothetical protein
VVAAITYLITVSRFALLFLVLIIVGVVVALRARRRAAERTGQPPEPAEEHPDRAPAQTDDAGQRA